MPKKKYIPFYKGSDLPPEREEYIKQRNGNVTRTLAETCGSDDDSPEKPYRILAAPVERSLAARYGMDSKDDFYGAVVDHPQHAHKTALHPTVPEADNVPKFHSERFAERVSEIVIPGYSAFSVEDAIRAFNKLHKKHGAIRLKDPAASEGKRQFVVESEDQLRKILNNHFKPFPTHIGVVMEVNLEQTSVTTCGLIHAPNKESATYFRGEQFEGDIPFDSGEKRVITGSALKVAKADSQDYDDPDFQIRRRAFRAYEGLIPICSRLSFNILEGRDQMGKILRGITKTTLNVNDLDPSVTSALETLRNPAIKAVIMETRKVLKKFQKMPFPGFRFVDTKDIALVTKITDFVRSRYEDDKRYDPLLHEGNELGFTLQGDVYQIPHPQSSHDELKSIKSGVTRRK